MTLELTEREAEIVARALASKAAEYEAARKMERTEIAAHLTRCADACRTVAHRLSYPDK